MDNTGTLKNKTIKGLVWSFIDLFSKQGIQFVVLMMLARILIPENFGLIGMIAIFIAISNSLIDSGFSQALIREKVVNRSEYSTIFFFNLFMSFVLYMILFYSAPFISEFFEEERLTAIIRVLSLGIIVNSLGIIQRVFLIKKIDFKTQTIISLFSSIIAGVLAIILAVKGFGVWSLVAQTLTLQITQTIFLWGFNRWTPVLAFHFDFLKRLFMFGSKLLVSGLIDTIYANIYSIIIGRLFLATNLGYFTNASKLSDVFTNTTTTALQRVTYPILSSIRDDENQLKSAYQKIITITTYCMFPSMVGLIAVADSLIPVLLGSKWNNSIIYFKLLCIAGMIYPLHALNLNILQVKGRSDLFLKLEIIKKTLLTLLMGASIVFSMGIIGLIGAGIICSYLSLFINTYYSAQEISYSTRQQFKDIFPSFLVAVIMGVCVYLVGNILPDNKLIKLLLQVYMGIILYVAMGWMFKLKEFEYLYSEFKNFYQRLKFKGLKSKEKIYEN